MEICLTPWNQNMILYTVNINVWYTCINILNICIHINNFFNEYLSEGQFESGLH